jgi:arylsulfatase A-like enzyme
LLACVLITSWSVIAFGVNTPSERPNVVLMMADDQGWGETGYNGHPHLQTPVLDEMALTALRLDRFYSGAPNCTPTRPSVMTGRHANRSGAFAPNWSTRPEEITMAHILKRAGYRTGHFGRWHLGAVKAESPVNPRRMGFDEYLSHDNFFEMDPPLSRNGEPPQVIAGESSEIVVSAAI